MDTAIANGDFKVGLNGIPMSLDEYEEELQRAKIRLNVRKGSFIYDPDFGSRLFTLKNSTGDLDSKAKFLAAEALIDMPQVMVENAECAKGSDQFSIKVALSTIYGSATIVVKI